MSNPKPVVLCILDGWGDREAREANAPALADTPNFDRIRAAGPVSHLTTHGPEVGLPEGQMGNSEVGHTNIGAGRVVAMDLGQIDLAIEDGSFFENAALRGFVSTLRQSGGTAHLLGMVSDGGVHGHLDHIAAAARTIAEAGVPVVIHAMTDGRDVAPKSAAGFLEDLEAKLPDGCKHRHGDGPLLRHGPRQSLGAGRGRLPRDRGREGPRDRRRPGHGGAAILRGRQDRRVHRRHGDRRLWRHVRRRRSLLPQFPRRPRARMLRAIGQPDFSEFDVSARPDPGRAARHGGILQRPHRLVRRRSFPKRKLVNTLGEWVAKHGLRQFRLAETEKYPHVTFFLNGGKEEPEAGEDRAMPKSPKVATYDLQPEMSAAEVTDRFVEAIEAGYDLIVCNYANPDMVGHTGDLEAAIAACEAVDRGLGRVLDRAGDRRRRDDRHRRSRQLRNHGGSRDRRAAHLPHAQPGARASSSAGRRARRSPTAGSPIWRRRCWS